MWKCKFDLFELGDVMKKRIDSEETFSIIHVRIIYGERFYWKRRDKTRNKLKYENKKERYGPREDLQNYSKGSCDILDTKEP